MQGFITVKLEDVALGSAIDSTLRMNGLVLVEKEDGYHLLSREEADAAGLNTEMAFLYEEDLTQQLIDLTFKDMPLNMVVSQLATKANINIISKFEIEGKVTCDIKQINLDRALETVLLMNGLGIIKEGEIYQIVEERVATNSRNGDKYLFQ